MSRPNKVLLLAPHNDDECLWASFTILRHQPHVIVCLKSVLQEQRGGPWAGLREMETSRALWWLGAPTWEQWQFPDAAPDWAAITIRLIEIRETTPSIEVIFAPAIEENGHEHHTEIGALADRVFGEENVVHYATYRRGYGRTKTNNPVSFEPQWVMRKLRAMSCYESQFSDKLGTMPWFVDEGLREFYE